MKKHIIIITLTFLHFFCFCFSSVFAMEKDVSHKVLYSAARKLDTPDHYLEVKTPEEEKEFYSYAIKVFNWDDEYEKKIVDEYKINTSNLADVEELFKKYKNEGINLYEEIADNLIKDMYLSLRQKSDIILPIGIIQNQPILLNNEASDCVYTLGTGLCFSNRFLLTAEHVLGNGWFLQKEDDRIISSGEVSQKWLKKNENQLTPLHKKLTYFPFKEQGETATVIGFLPIVDDITCTGMDENFNIISVVKNGIDIGVAILDQEIKSDFKIEFATELPKFGEKLYVASIEKDDEDDEILYFTEQSEILTYADVEKYVNDKDKKMLFLKNAVIPGVSGAPVLLSKEGNNILIFGVFNKKIDITNDGKVMPLFAFSPVNAIMINKKVKELEEKYASIF